MNWKKFFVLCIATIFAVSPFVLFCFIVIRLLLIKESNLLPAILTLILLVGIIAIPTFIVFLWKTLRDASSWKTVNWKEFIVKCMKGVPIVIVIVLLWMGVAELVDGCQNWYDGYQYKRVISNEQKKEQRIAEKYEDFIDRYYQGSEAPPGWRIGEWVPYKTENPRDAKEYLRDLSKQ